MDSNIFVIYSNPNQQYINKLEYITSRSSNNMATTLANLVTKQYGFNDLNDNQTEIGKENLQQAIPALKCIESLLIENYKYAVKECFKKGIRDHNDAAKVLRRILKEHNKALIYRRTTMRDNAGKQIGIYKYRMT